MSNQNRVPEGVPTGGQFAGRTRGEAAPGLLAAPVAADGVDLSTQTWYHGSKHVFETFKPGGPTKTRTDWNTSMGNHVALDRATAEEFTDDDGVMYEVRLDIRAAKRYGCEEDLYDEAAGFLIEGGHRLGCCNPATEAEWEAIYEDSPEHYDGHGFEVGYLAGERDDTRGRYWLTALAPERQASTAAEFRQHLRSRGYDGIAYANGFEGVYGNECAIALDPTQSHLTRLTLDPAV